MSRRFRTPRSAIVVGVTVASTLAAITLTPATSLAAQGGKKLPSSIPRWAVSANDAGATPATTDVEGEIYLPLRNEIAAQALATAVATPGSKRYRHPVTPQEWIKTYSPTANDVTAITTYLTGRGLTVTAIPASRQFVVFRGSAAAVNAAFATQLHTFRYAGRQLAAPSTVPSVPASIAAVVQGLTIDQGRQVTRPDLVRATPRAESAAAPRAKGSVAPSSCSTYFGEHSAAVPSAYGRKSFPTNICGYVPDQLRSAYGLTKGIGVGLDGSGQTIAIIDAYASPTIVSDTNTYALRTGSAPLLASQYQQIVPAVADFVDTAACGTTAGWQGEQTLDVQSAHGVAPGAGILYVGGFNCGGGLDVAMSTILDDKRADIVSNSYGYAGEAVPTSVLYGEQHQHIQAAAEGIGLYFSSGDNGDEINQLGYASPDFPASSPFVTSVGGTSLKVGVDGSYLGERGWGTAGDKIVQNKYASPLPGTFFGGAGGGVSDVFAQPAYQAGIVPDALASSKDSTTPARVSPDVAALADPYTGFLIGLSPITDDATQSTGAFVTETYGGTSLASPITAAQMALVQQRTKVSIGFANPLLYATYVTNASGFRDVLPATPGDAVVYTSTFSGNRYLISLDKDSSLKTTKGYDQTTGLGSLLVPLLAAAVR